MATVSSASEARFGTFWRNHFVLFQDLLSFFQAVFTLLHEYNGALVTKGEAALPVSQGEAAVHRHHRLEVQLQLEAKSQHEKTVLRFCGRKGRQRLYLKKRPLVFPLLCEKEEEVVAVAAAAASSKW